MALVKQMVMTSNGPKPARDMLCYKCGERRPGLFTVNANGQSVCEECSGSLGKGVLSQVCDPETCACGKVDEDAEDAE